MTLVNVAVLFLCLFQFQADPTRPGQQGTWENPNRVITNDMAPDPALLKLQQRRFEQAFNKLASAVEEFSVAYNQSKGMAWPSDKANALRKAIVELQKVDPSFKIGSLLEAKR